MYAPGSVIDSFTQSSNEPLLACLADSASLSRSGPPVPFAPAGAKVWQAAQPCAVNTAFPAAGSPFTCAGGFGSGPTTVVGVGVTTLFPGFEQPAATTTSR